MKDTSQRPIFCSHDYSHYTRMAQCYHLITFGETKHLIGKHDLSFGATQKRLEREGSRGCLKVPKAPHSLFQRPIIGIKWWGHCLPISKHRCLRLPLGTLGIRAWITTVDSRSQCLQAWLFSATCSPRLAQVLDCAGFDGLQEPEKGWQRHKMTQLLCCPTG